MANVVSEVSESTGTEWAFRQPVFWASGVFLLASLATLTAPSSDNPPARVGGALLVGGVAIALAALLQRWLPGILTGGLSAILGAALVIDTDRFLSSVSWALALSTTAAAALAFLWLRRAGFSGFVAGATGLLMFGLGPLFRLYQRELLTLGLGTIGLVSALGLFTGIAVHHRREGPTPTLTFDDVGRAARFWLAERVTGDVVPPDLVDSLLLNPTKASLSRFYALMGFASVIASFGVLTDSTAVVIGAMLVAPLMTPLMGLSLSLVSGWTERVARTSIIVISAVAIPILTGALSTAVMGLGIDPATNSQITSRANPTLLDLAIALAAGAAGAYATSRRDVADSLPGVAVAIALVPPLAVVGVSAQLGDWSAASGSMLLFVTNVVAIIATGSLTFTLTGAAGAQDVSRGDVGHWVVGFAAAGLAVIWGLAASSAANNRQGAYTSMAREAATGWAVDRGYEIEAVAVEGDVVTVTVAGPEAPDDEAVGRLVDAIEEPLGPVSVDLRVYLRQRILVEGD